MRGQRCLITDSMRSSSIFNGYVAESRGRTNYLDAVKTISDCQPPFTRTFGQGLSIVYSVSISLGHSNPTELRKRTYSPNADEN